MSIVCETTNDRISILVLIVSLVSPVFATDKNFYAELSGSEVVPPVKTTAKGMATFQISKDGKEMTYKLTVSDIENVPPHISMKGNMERTGHLW